MSPGGTLEPLSPKHIQARVRAGASAEVIAAETGWALDRVIRYAGPPLAERAYVAERAASVEIRRDAGGQSVTLDASVNTALEAMGLVAGAVAWDAWRRVDGKWIVCVTHPGLPQGTIATWSYDPAGRNLHPLDETARRFMETGYVSVTDFLGIDDEQVPEPDQGEVLSQRPRLVAVPEAPAARAAEPPGPPVIPSAPAAEGSAARRPQPGSLARQPTVALPRDHEAPRDTPAADAAAAGAPGIASRRTPTEDDTPQPKSRAKGRRASVPSWDEILFGASKNDDR